MLFSALTNGTRPKGLGLPVNYLKKNKQRRKLPNISAYFRTILGDTLYNALLISFTYFSFASSQVDGARPSFSSTRSISSPLFKLLTANVSRNICGETFL